MTDRGSWHDQDAFWELVEPMLFNTQRLELAKEQVQQVEKLLQLPGGARILDLCCGVGRHSIELADLGYAVTGVDRTQRYIEQARQTALARGLGPVFLVGDMRDYRSPDGYDAVLNMFGSFGYFADEADDRKVVANMYEALRPGGQVLIETMGKEILARQFQERNWHEVDDLLILSEQKITQNWGRVETRWIAIRGTERIEHHVSIHSYSAVELSSLLADVGFREIRVFGSLDGIEYNQDAQRLVVVARK
ncbi:MAG: class I SAM-dependent methyltransferase [Anaerolineae bacterium]|nr:class I SAM-dependent methyltransferase [Anaerolineae bacterium]